MPRFANIKGSMNPFDNNRPVLNSSDRTRNKKSKYIYAAAKQKFQTKRRCNGKNIKYYKKGMVRSVANYKLQQDLARGNVLCEDCDNKGSLCKGISNKKSLNSIQMGNNKVSEFWGGGFLSYSTAGGVFSGLVQAPGFPVIQSDVTGVWDPSAATITNPSKGTLAPGFGYIDNIIRIPRNLNGSGIVIDPSNILFPNSNCGRAPYLKHTNLKTYLVIRGAVPISPDYPAYWNAPPMCPPHIPPYSPDFKYYTPGPANCCDNSYNSLIGTIVVLGFGGAGTLGPDENKFILSGVIRNICSVRSQKLGYYIDIPPLFTVENDVDIFDTYIELFYINDYVTLQQLINAKPAWDCIGMEVSTHLVYCTDCTAPPCLPPAETIEYGPYTCNYGWRWPEPFFRNTHLYFEGESSGLGEGGDWGDWLIESFNIIQGTIPPLFNQTKYNATKQSYLSCLEDGTKKINFANNNTKINPFIKSYCKD